MATKEQHYFLGEHQKRVAFYTTLITAVAGATVSGLFVAKNLEHYVALLLGPLWAIVVSIIAMQGTERMYQRFLEAITVKTKLEHDLRLDGIRSTGADDEWFQREPFVAKRHLKSRRRQSNYGEEEHYPDSETWVKEHLKKGENYHGATRALFKVMICFSILGLLGLAYVLWQKG